jgi:carboxyl-terminal processing protease
LIQSPYNEGYDKYLENFYERYTNGELMNADSIHFPDSLKFRTLVNKRTVYGGGGIMPDLFVPADTSHYSDYFRSLVRRGILNSFALEYSDKNRKSFTSRYRQFDDFKEKFSFPPEEITLLIKKAEDSGVKYDDSQFKISQNEILTVLKGLVASNLWQSNEYYRIINDDDVTIMNALRIVSDKTAYNKILGYK